MIDINKRNFTSRAKQSWYKNIHGFTSYIDFSLFYIYIYINEYIFLDFFGIGQGKVGNIFGGETNLSLSVRRANRDHERRLSGAYHQNPPMPPSDIGFLAHR